MTGPLALSLAASASPAEAHITRIEITRTESPTFQGVSFGDVGPYEKLMGRAFGEVDPKDPRNRVIVDIGLAPRNDRGMVEYSTDVCILRSVDPSRAIRKVFFDINNRGNAVGFGVMNDTLSGCRRTRHHLEAGCRGVGTARWCVRDRTASVSPLFPA